MNMSYAKMDIRKTLTTGVAPPRLSKTGSPEYIGRRCAHDSIRDYFNLYRDISIADVLWQLDCSDYRLSR